MRENNPWQFNEPYLEEAVNAFWMEFFFTGKPEPLLKIANQLRNRPILTSAEARKKKGGLSPAEARKLRNYFSASCAAWSLRSHVPQHNLAFYYLENMLERGSFADAAAAAKVRKILAQTAADAAGNTVDLGVDLTATNISFTMPDYDIHVEALEKNASSGGSGGLGDIDFGDLSEGDSEWAIINIIRNIIAMFKSFLQQLIETFQSIGD